MIRSKEVVSVKPVCPFCEKEIEEILYRRIESVLGKRYAYFCPVCKKVLGITHRKGFWMG